MIQAGVLAAAFVFLAWFGGFALAQAAPGFNNSKIIIYSREDGDLGYWTTSSGNPKAADPSKRGPRPMRAQSMAVRQLMMQRRVLEQYAEFLSPLRLPRPLRLFASDCEGNLWDSPYYDPGPSRRWINLCYPFMGEVVGASNVLVKKQGDLALWTPVSSSQLAAGMFAATLLHEAGHAVFDLLDVPVFGREEDAADQMAAFIALQFGRDTARTVIKGFAYFWAYEAKVNKADPGAAAVDISTDADPAQRCFANALCAFSDVHGTASQRMYNTLCLAYGAQPAEFHDLVDSGWLPAARAHNCEQEYRQAYEAFRKTVFPFIDQRQMQKVLARQDWFQPSEMKEK